MSSMRMDLGSDTDNIEEIDSAAVETKKADKRKAGVVVSGKRKRRLTSKVWVNYDILSDEDEFGNMLCKCKKCGTIYNADSKQGTGNLIRHVKNCKMRTYRDVGQMLLQKTSTGLESRQVKYDADEFRELVAMAIVQHDLPFQFVEYVGIRKCFSYLHPDFKPITRNTVKADVLKMFKREKLKLRCELIDIPGRISLTSDCWTSLVTDGYISLTAHYVDMSWTLQKRILNLSFLPPPHTGIHLCDHIFNLLKEWGIQKNIFSLTLDNASSNDVFVENLKGELDLVCEGQFFHVRCCAHILNLIVQDGLKEIDSAVVKVRESVKYCKGSQSRKEKFLNCVGHVELDSSKGLKQDVPTRWNSTYLMLESALYFKKALIHFQKVDANYIRCPSSEEWVRVEKIFKFLKVFYDATLAFSGTKYPTANLYLPNVLKVRLLLKREKKSVDPFMSSMAEKMYAKFEKYWSSFSTFMAVAVVLDPRYKLEFVEWGFRKVYDTTKDFDDAFGDVCRKMRALYEHYATMWRSKQAAAVYVKPKTIVLSDDDDMNDFDEFSTKKAAVTPKDFLDLYYDDILLPRASNLDILQYWRANAIRFPPVALMARDLLAVPISIVASESAFSTGSRVLDSFRSNLKPSTVEALICLRDWTFGEANVEDAQLEQLCADVMKLKVGDEVEDLPSANAGTSSVGQHSASLMHV